MQLKLLGYREWPRALALAAIAIAPLTTAPLTASGPI
jgi:hypothetical protein